MSISQISEPHSSFPRKVAPLTEALSVRVGCFKDQRNANDGIDPNFPPSADFPRFEAEGGCAKWVCFLAFPIGGGGCIGITGICLVCVCLLGQSGIFPDFGPYIRALIGGFCTIHFLDDICGSY